LDCSWNEYKNAGSTGKKRCFNTNSTDPTITRRGVSCPWDAKGLAVVLSVVVLIVAVSMATLIGTAYLRKKRREKLTERYERLMLDDLE